MAGKRLLNLEFTLAGGTRRMSANDGGAYRPAVLRVERSDEGRVEIEPKSRAGRRSVPIAGALRGVLIEIKTYQDHEVGLVFGTSAKTVCDRRASGAEH